MTLQYPSLAATRFCASARVAIELIEEALQKVRDAPERNGAGDRSEWQEFGRRESEYTTALVDLKEGLYDYERTLAFSIPRATRPTP